MAGDIAISPQAVDFLSIQINTRLVVITDLSKKFISGWKLSEAQLTHVPGNGNLGGGL